MPAGFQVWNGSGQLLSEYTDRLSRILGIQYLDVGGGTISVPGFTLGTPFFQFQDVDFQFEGELPQVTLGSSTLSWAYRGLYAKKPATIFYGVY